jgi:hypothetical protein
MLTDTYDTSPYKVRSDLKGCVRPEGEHAHTNSTHQARL